jgi:wyosine [tRNA(Phe)-imidazoG37] synthetase (radical SAM superfamily)
MVAAVDGASAVTGPRAPRAPGKWRRVKIAARQVMPVPIWRTLQRLKRSARNALFRAHDRAWMLDHLPTQPSELRLLTTVIGQFEREELARAYAHDPWLRNYLVNVWEYVQGEALLTTYPWNVTVPIADVCNARCTFCTSWLEGTRVLSLDEVPKFGEILPFARTLGIAGHGEPLAHPQCEEIFERISRYLDPRCESYVITNGVFLERRLASLRRLNTKTFNISLNAATNDTHERVMGLGRDALKRVLSTTRRLVHERETWNTELQVTISFVINRDNVHELAAFVRLGNELGVDSIYLRTLMPIGSLPWGLNYHALPPHLDPDFREHVHAAKKAIVSSRSRVITDVDSWESRVLSEPLQEEVRRSPPRLISRVEAARDPSIREKYSRYYEDSAGLGRPVSGVPDNLEDGSNPYGRAAHYHCSFVYHDFIINDFNMRLIPCCYMTQVPGFEAVRFDGTRPFFEHWNSPAFVTLRRRLMEGPLYGACKKCPAQELL